MMIKLIVFVLLFAFPPLAEPQYRIGNLDFDATGCANGRAPIYNDSTKKFECVTPSGVSSPTGVQQPRVIPMLIPPNLIEEAQLVRNPVSGNWTFPVPSSGSIVRYFVFKNGLFQRKGIQYTVISSAVPAISFLPGALPADTVVMLYQVQ